MKYLHAGAIHYPVIFAIYSFIKKSASPQLIHLPPNLRYSPPQLISSDLFKCLLKVRTDVVYMLDA